MRTERQMDEQTDKQTGMTKVTDALRNFANETKHCLLVKYLYKSL
jgi:hypothetical protein